MKGLTAVLLDPKHFLLGEGKDNLDVLSHPVLAGVFIRQPHDFLGGLKRWVGG